MKKESGYHGDFPALNTPAKNEKAKPEKGVKSFKEISEEYGVSIDSVKRHFKNHVIRHIEPIISYESAEYGPIIVIIVDGVDCHIPAGEYIKNLKTRLTICQTEEELAEGRAHSAHVKTHYERMGEPERFEEQIEALKEMYPGFRPVV